MQPHESARIELDGKPYALTLNQSQFIVLKECSITFEGGRSQLDFSVVRAANKEREHASALKRVAGKIGSTYGKNGSEFSDLKIFRRRCLYHTVNTDGRRN